MADKFNKQAQLDNFNAKYPTRWNKNFTFGIYRNSHGAEFVVIRTEKGTRFESIN